MVQGGEGPLSEVGERQERFAALIGADRTAILAAYARSLDAWPNPVVAEPCGRDQVMASGAEVLADVLASVWGGDGHPMPAAGAGLTAKLPGAGSGATTVWLSP